MIVQDRINTALTIAAEGGKADIAKPLKGFGLSVMEITVRYRTMLGASFTRWKRTEDYG